MNGTILLRTNAVLVLALTLSTVHAQTGTQAVLAGRVVDPDGDPMPGVTVTAQSPSTAMTPAGAVSDSEGRYRIAALPPRNDYLVVAEVAGFARVEVGPVDLDPGRTTTVNLTLLPASEATEKVVVVAQGDMVDLTSTKTSTVFNSEFIEGLPILGRTYQSILTLAPGVTDVDGDGNPNVNGARDTEFQTRVDGANTTDPFTGTLGQNLNIEAIAEIEVITTGFPAEYSGAQGGFANIITKSGGNEFEGSFKFFFRSDLFDNDGANNNDLSDTDLFSSVDGFGDFRPVLTLGGPLVRDRLWYFASFEHISTEVPVNAGNLAFLQTEDGWNNFAKITWQVNPAHRLAFQVNHDPRRFTGLNLRTGVAPESDVFLDEGGTVGTVRWTHSISPSLVLEALASRLDIGVDILPISDPAPCLTDSQGRCNPFSEDLYTQVQPDGITHGPFFLTHRDTRRRDAIKSDLSFYVDSAWGQHSLKTGFELARDKYENSLRVDRRRIDRDLHRNQGPSPDEPSSGDRVAGSVHFRDAFPRSQIRGAERDLYGLYISDSYKPRPNVAINVGLRFDREEATTDGWEIFDPDEQARRFLELLAVGQGVPVESLDYATALRSPSILHDVNGDGRDREHCGDAGEDLYVNSTVTGFTVGDDGTYTLVGQRGSDGRQDNFFNFVDGNKDGSATFADGVSGFDPGITNYASPGDQILFFPGGYFPAGADYRDTNPNCDRSNEDARILYQAFSRHQLDEVGIPGLSFEGDVLGTLRSPEAIRIVNNNLAPRLGISWDPWSNNKTRFFAFWGRYYGSLHLDKIVSEVGPDFRTTVYGAKSIILGAAATPSEIGRFDISQVDRDLSTPFTDEYNFGFERELAPNWVLTFTYVKREDRELLQDVDLNHFVRDENGDGILDDGFGHVVTVGPGDSGPGSGSVGLFHLTKVPDGLPDLYAYNPFFAQILRIGNFNSADHTSYQLQLTRRLSRNWQMTASYVLSEVVGDAETFDSLLGDDLGAAQDEFGPLDYDQTHVIKFSAVTHLPREQTIGGILQWASGLPFSVIRSSASSGDSFGSFFPRITYPTGQRNDQRNEGTWRFDATYRKSFTFGSVNATLGIEVQDLLNSDDLRIYRVDQAQLLGLAATRDFGRRWQLSMGFHF